MLTSMRRNDFIHERHRILSWCLWLMGGDVDSIQNAYHVYIISFVHFDTAMHVIIDQKIRSKANTQRGTGFLCVICSGGLHLRVFKVSKKCDIRFIWGLRSRNYYAKRLSPNLHCKVIHPDGYNICFVGAIMTNFISKSWVLFANLS